MTDLNVSLNSTFSIEEEKSFLSNFGTPYNFKKLMEKPATQNLDFSFEVCRFQLQLFSIITIFQTANTQSPFSIRGRKLNQKLLAGSQRKSILKQNNDSFSALIPVNSSVEHFTQSTPYRDRNNKENLVADFQAVKIAQPFHPSPSMNFVWSLKNKREEAEKKTEEERQKQLKEPRENEKRKAEERSKANDESIGDSEDKDLSEDLDYFKLHREQLEKILKMEEKAELRKAAARAKKVSFSKPVPTRGPVSRPEPRRAPQVSKPEPKRASQVSKPEPKRNPVPKEKSSPTFDPHLRAAFLAKKEYELKREQERQERIRILRQRTDEEKKQHKQELKELMASVMEKPDEFQAYGRLVQLLNEDIDTPPRVPVKKQTARIPAVTRPVTKVKQLPVPVSRGITKTSSSAVPKATRWK